MFGVPYVYTQSRILKVSWHHVPQHLALLGWGPVPIGGGVQRLSS